MIARIRGKVLCIEEESLVVDVQGLGYELFCSANTMDQILPGDDVDLQVFTHVREEVLQLFGFIDRSEKSLFLSLCKVNGIGPKMAMQILSGARPEMIISWIDQGDVKALMKLPKLGKKKAEQLVLSLKGKLVMEEDAQSVLKLSPEKQDLKSALMNLGYNEEQVEGAIKEIGDFSGLENGIRKGLGILSAGL
ncbi:MAG: Holliday junction branch migration protein RuvA [Bdellovibrionaceae bacterium]|nr:Holliday junction branch migration protein RuvA [Pseudobdellovibrionaceae bacterium]|tara:strand:+ start:53495 stop:54073 length:579 start_codon:yes stop_codon:yes gene_type:complete